MQTSAAQGGLPDTANCGSRVRALLGSLSALSKLGQAGVQWAGQAAARHESSGGTLCREGQELTPPCTETVEVQGGS